MRNSKLVLNKLNKGIHTLKIYQVLLNFYKLSLENLKDLEEEKSKISIELNLEIDFYQ